MGFAGDGRLVIMAETKIFVAKIAAKQGKVVYPWVSDSYPGCDW